MSDNVHPDFEQIMREAEENLVGSAKADMLNDFKALEQSMFDRFGDPDQVHELWACVAVANSATKDQYINDNPNIPIANPEMNNDPSASGLMGVTKLGVGSDIYEPLNDAEVSLIVSDIKDCVGVVIRCGAWAKDVNPDTPDDGVRPSESPNKVNGVVTMMATDSAIMSAFRNLVTGDVHHNQTLLNDYEQGESSLSDALLKFWAAPKILKRDHPEKYAELLEFAKDNVSDDDSE